MARTIHILVQTTTPARPDDWSIDSLSLLTRELASIEEYGVRFEVTARNRESGSDPDRVLSKLDSSNFDELWLFALDTGGGLTQADCAAITRFRRRGGGILSTRDHQDMGSSLCSLGGIGAAHNFHTINPEEDPTRRMPDDLETPSIAWPNYHSGKNGDFQRITPGEPVHELLENPANHSGRIERFPSHPHEGAVNPPAAEPTARVIARGKSLTTGRSFNLGVAFERTKDASGHTLGRGVADSSFHHFADYNWDTSLGAPSFVTESEGRGMKEDPRALADIRRYVRNLAFWLAPAA